MASLPVSGPVEMQGGSLTINHRKRPHNWDAKEQIQQTESTTINEKGPDRRSFTTGNSSSLSCPLSIVEQRGAPAKVGEHKRLALGRLSLLRECVVGEEPGDVADRHAEGGDGGRWRLRAPSTRRSLPSWR